MLTAVIFLACIGILLVGLEFILPGGIVGALGAIMLVVALALSFFVEDLDVAGRSILAGSIFIAMIIGTVLWFRFLNSRFFSDKFGLKEQAGVTNRAREHESLIGQEGLAKTVLRPSGKAVIEGKSYDVTAEAGLIEQGASIRVVKTDGLKIVVRRLPTVSE